MQKFFEHPPEFGTGHAYFRTDKQFEKMKLRRKSKRILEKLEARAGCNARKRRINNSKEEKNVTRSMIEEYQVGLSTRGKWGDKNDEGNEVVLIFNDRKAPTG